MLLNDSACYTIKIEMYLWIAFADLSGHWVLNIF